MSDGWDWNGLDKAIFRLSKSTAELPEVFRRLTEGDLFALVPYHPEIVDTRMQIENGSPFHFIMTKDGEAVMLFSSDARAEESLKKNQVPPNTYCAAKMPARQMLEILGKMDLRALLNQSCTTGCFILPPDLMRDLASGVALQPLPFATKREEKTFHIIDPADYPTADPAAFRIAEKTSGIPRRVSAAAPRTDTCGRKALPFHASDGSARRSDCESAVLGRNVRNT